MRKSFLAEQDLLRFEHVACAAGLFLSHVLLTLYVSSYPSYPGRLTHCSVFLGIGGSAVLVNQLTNTPLRALEALAFMAESHSSLVWDSLLTYSGTTFSLCVYIYTLSIFMCVCLFFTFMIVIYIYIGTTFPLCVYICRYMYSLCGLCVPRKLSLHQDVYSQVPLQSERSD